MEGLVLTLSSIYSVYVLSVWPLTFSIMVILAIRIFVLPNFIDVCDSGKARKNKYINHQNNYGGDLSAAELRELELMGFGKEKRLKNKKKIKQEQ